MAENQEKKETHDLIITPDQREKQEAEDLSISQELSDQEVFKTQHSDGHTVDPHLAEDQGLTYTPPTDPPIVPGRDPQGAEVAAGFDLSMEAGEAEAERLPDRVAHSDLGLRDNIYAVLRANSETGHLTNVKVQVENGVVNLVGTVESQDDIGRVQDIVAELEGVTGIRNNLQTGEIRDV